MMSCLGTVDNIEVKDLAFISFEDEIKPTLLEDEINWQQMLERCALC